MKTKRKKKVDATLTSSADATLCFYSKVLVGNNHRLTPSSNTIVQNYNSVTR